MHKLNIGLIVAVVLLVGTNVFQFKWWNDKNTEIEETYTAKVAELNTKLSSYGSEVDVYTVKSAVKAGDEITSDNIEVMKTYSSVITEQYVTNIDDIVGRYYKIAVNPGTPIMKNMAMDEELIDSMRDRDIVLDRLTVGLEVGDYIDIRMTMPYGDDYVVIPHKRVYGINDGTIKLYLSELEWNTYQGALIDYFLNAEYGCTLYADKYVEPGIQQSAVNFYAVPTNIAALLQKNPNIVDKAEAASLNDWRKSLEDLLVIFRDEDDTVDADGSRLASGRQGINEAVESDRQSVADEKAEQEEAAADEEVEEEVSEDFWSDDPTADTSDTTTETTTEEGVTE